MENKLEFVSVAEHDFVLLLLAMYRNYPVLWHVKSKYYFNKKKRSLALREIVCALQKYRPDFTEEKLKKKINVLRSNFNKEFLKIEQLKRSALSDDDIPESTLYYYNDLLFIKQQEIVDTKEEKCLQEPLIEQPLTSCAGLIDPLPVKIRKATSNDIKDHLMSLQNFKRQEDEVDIIAKGWAIKLKRLAPDQRLFAEKIINDTLFEGELGTLTRESIGYITSS